MSSSTYLMFIQAFRTFQIQVSDGTFTSREALEAAMDALEAKGQNLDIPFVLDRDHYTGLWLGTEADSPDDPSDEISEEYEASEEMDDDEA
jgi:hypothetical protein